MQTAHTRQHGQDRRARDMLLLVGKMADIKREAKAHGCEVRRAAQSLLYVERPFSSDEDKATALEAVKSCAARLRELGLAK